MFVSSKFQSDGQLPAKAAMKTSNLPTTMTRSSVLNRRLKNLVIICSILILILSVALVYRAFTSKVFMHPHRRSLSFSEDKRSHKLHPKRTISYSDTTIQDFKNDLMFADLIPKKSKNSKDNIVITGAHKNILLNFFAKLHPTNWDKVVESDDMAFGLKYLFIECNLESRMSCKQIDNLNMDGYAEKSQSKMVEHVHEMTEQTSGGHNRKYAVRSLVRDNNIACAAQKENADICATRDDYRLLKEVFLLTTLKHPGIVHMKGYCLRGNQVSDNLREKGIILVTEIGITLTDAVLEVASWSQRVSMALQVSKLLLYLDRTFLGSLRFTKLSLSDFVLVRGTLLKLANLDNLELGNIPCTDNSHCHLLGIDKGFQCINKYCSGMNPVSNLYMATSKVLKLLLQKPPGPAEVALVERLDSFNISTKELVNELFRFFRQNPPEGPVMFRPEEMDKMTNKGHNRMGHLSYQESEARKKESETQKALSQFVRFEKKNFVSIYDYLCQGSVEPWGCVFTVTSLRAAAKLCLTDDHCQAFVAFSTHPEAENVMRVVLKNAVDTKPAVDSKTTLFIKRGQEKTLEDRTRQDQSPRSKSVLTVQVQTCLNQVMLSQVSSRNILEKSLMNHLGYKGFREQAWKKAASKQDFRSPPEVIKSFNTGGKFLLNFANSSEHREGTVNKIMFISEDGPRAYHKAYAILYQLDRIFGLYHTPPCVGHRLSSDVVEYLHHNIVWDETFRSLISPDGTLSGILVVPAPKDFSEKVLTLKPLRTMTSEITAFDKSSRLQLEYVLLMWLGRMEKLTETLAYKNHYIHFNADTAFSSLGTDMSGYLNHCQFPSEVYEVLQCFRCHTEGQTTSGKVCYLGDEVMSRTRAMFPDEPNILIQSLKESDIVTAMNSAATSAMHIVDTCIDYFGRDHVLY